MRILGIDPGTVNMAMCLLDDSSHDTWRIKAGEHENPAYRLFDLERQVTLNMPKDIDLIVHEGLAYCASNRVAESGKVEYIIQRSAIYNNIQFITISPPTLRRFLKIKTTKEGKSKGKTDLALAVYKRWNIEFPSQDETDAFILAQIGMAILKKEFELTAPKKPKKVKEKQ